MTNYLYILVRTDMDSLGRGKAVAQGAHAANAFTWDNIIAPSIQGVPMNADALEWSREADGFGTTISLGMNLRDMQAVVEFARLGGFPARLVADPEYPLLCPGGEFHIVPNVVTTAYIFGDKDILRPLLGRFELLSNDPIPKG